MSRLSFHRRVPRALVVALLAITALVTGALVIPTSASAAPSTSVLTDIRVARHATYDRIVLDFAGPAPADHSSAWVRQLVGDASGRPISLPGRDFLRVVVRNAAAHTLSGQPSYTRHTPLLTPGLRNVRAVTLAGDFEGVLSVGIGTRHRAWVHLFTLSAPSRLVIDIGR
jgi:hypothetical protein